MMKHRLFAVLLVAACSSSSSDPASNGAGAAPLVGTWDVQFLVHSDFESAQVVADPQSIHVSVVVKKTTSMEATADLVLLRSADGTQLTGSGSKRLVLTYTGQPVAATTPIAPFTLTRTSPAPSEYGDLGGEWSLTSEYRHCTIQIQGGTFSGNCSTTAGKENSVYPSGAAYAFNGTGTGSAFSGSDLFGAQFAATKR